MQLSIWMIAFCFVARDLLATVLRVVAPLVPWTADCAAVSFVLLLVCFVLTYTFFQVLFVANELLLLLLLLVCLVWLTAQHTTHSTTTVLSQLHTWPNETDSIRFCSACYRNYFFHCWGLLVAYSTPLSERAGKSLIFNALLW
jgi:hypothetical protein